MSLGSVGGEYCCDVSASLGPNQYDSPHEFQDAGAYLSSSFTLEPAVFLRLGTGILHSIEKATQLVQGTPRAAASHRTCRRVTSQRGTAPEVLVVLFRTFRAWHVCSDVTQVSPTFLEVRVRHARPSLPRTSVWEQMDFWTHLTSSTRSLPKPMLTYIIILTAGHPTCGSWDDPESASLAQECR